MKIVKDQIEINASKEKIWDVLTTPDLIKLWDDIPENYTGRHLTFGSVIEWEGYSKLTVTELNAFNILKLKMFFPKVDLDESEYDVSYNYLLSGNNEKTVLFFEIGNFSPLPDAQNYFDTTRDWLASAKLKIKELAER